jgi:serine/threonine protein kinase
MSTNVVTDWPDEVGLDVDAYAHEVGSVFAAFLLQDSGCRAYGVAVDGERWFLKGPVEPRAVASLARAVAVHARVAHPAIIPLHGRVTTPTGVVLVYPWVDGEVLSGPPVDARAERRGPDSPHGRFRQLPMGDVLATFDAILDAHVAVTAAGFVAVDLYDGCFLYDFGRRRVWLCDLDEYRPGPFAVDADRLPGSTRFMAPEEWRRGATVDKRTSVFNLGRTGLVLLDEGPDAPDAVGPSFRGTRAMGSVLTCATRTAPDERYETVDELVVAWRRAARMVP